MTNVLVSPHNSAAATGNDDRVFRLFADNLLSRHQGSTLANEVTI
jgi:phosphoglycerate dehydrogenase-like enzyme